MSEKMKIYTYPDRILRVKAETVRDIDGETQIFIDRMAETMYAAPGIGLAANQVGEARRILVYDLSAKENGRSTKVLINPEIVFAEGEIVQEEACLSVVDFSADVARAAKIVVQGVDRHGNDAQIEAEGLLSICLQHEIDHLNGLLFIDHVSALKRALYNKKLKKKLKNAEG